MIRPIATPATGALIGTPASISARVLPQVLAIEVLPLLESTSETRRIVYGNSSSSGDDGHERALGERAVADVAPAGAAQRPRLADGERREVVVVHVALRLFRLEGVQLLLVAHRAERGDREDLRLAAREEAGAVRSRQEADLGADRADLVRACGRPGARRR